jgi:hypothetical protein
MTEPTHEDAAGEPTVPSADVQAEMEQLRAERDAALAEVSQARTKHKHAGRFRSIVVITLVVLISLLVPITATTVWVRHTVLNTDNYVATVAPLGEDPAVTEAIGRIATTQLFDALNPQQQVAAALPPKAEFLAGPITNGIENFIQTQVTKALNTAVFEQIWVAANTIAHKALLRVLEGHSDAVSQSNGYVTLNLVPLLNNVLTTLSDQISGIIGHTITLPTITADEVPAQACQKLSTALNRQLPDNCAQIPLFKADQLNTARRAVALFKSLTVVLVIVTPLLLALALWLSRTRRRTLIQTSVGVLLVTVILRRTMMWLQKDLINTGRPENKPARQVIVHQLLNGFFGMTVWLLWITLAVLVIAVITGPYRWAVRGREFVTNSARSAVAWTRTGYGKATTGAAGSGWIPAHVDALRIAGVGVGLLLILVLSVSWVGLIIIVALVALWEFWLVRVGAAAGERPAT